jgi:hypothetical protein
MESATMSNLSPQQRNILKWLINCVRFAEQHNRSLLKTGFTWGINIQDKACENSRRASLCRSLARLEQRGLLIRIRGRKQTRTTRLRLTDEGHCLAEAITTF